MKAAWKEQARSGPLLYAAAIFDEDSDLQWYAPDDDTYLDEAIEFVQDQKSLLTFFGVALFCQNKLARLLDKAAAAKIQLLKFPRLVKPIDPQLDTFDGDQLKILDEYVAPQ